MKKVFQILFAVVCFVSLVGCGRQSHHSLRVAIVKQLDHASIDEIASAIEQEIHTLDESVDVQVYSGQNDQSTLMQIGSQVVGNGVDVIIPIGTLAAQTMVVASEESQTALVYGAISNPKAAGLLEISRVTGTSDALNTAQMIEMMLVQNPQIKKVGLLYSTSETNSQKPIADAKHILDEKKIAYVEASANNSGEVVMAASSLIASGVDAVFTPTDNVIMSAELSIYEMLVNANIPHYAGADSFVRSGAFVTCGVNYTDLGKQTGKLAIDVAKNGFDGVEDMYVVDGGIITVNQEVADSLGVDPSIFSSFGNVVTVTTTGE